MGRLKHTPMMPTLQRRITHRGPGILRRKPMQQRRIGPKLLRPAMKLPRIAQQNLAPPAKRTHHASNPNILLPERVQITDSFPVPIRAHNRKPALLVRRVRTAKIQKPRPIGQLHHVIHMCSNANILVLVRQSVFR